jgi:photosystem II stability/assembly factor-like uncharacterized protein
VGIVLLAAGLLGTASGATSATTVTVTVASAVSLTNNCQANSAVQLGTVLPGSTAITATGANVCSFQFQSSNDTSMLRMTQSDGTGMAMDQATGTWSSVQPGTATNLNWGVTAYDNNTVMAVDDGSDLKRSTDGGQTWTTFANITGTADNLHNIAYVPADNTTWWTVGDHRLVYKITSALGAPTYTNEVGDLNAKGWGPNVNVHGVLVRSSSDIVITGDNGLIAETLNGGTNWNVYTVGTDTITGISMVPATNTYYASTFGGNVLTTTTGASGVWTTMGVGLGPLNAVSVADATHMYVVGNLGAIGFCGGTCGTATNWVPREDLGHIPRNLMSVSTTAAAPNTAVVGGFDGTFAVTTNAGVNWTPKYVTGWTIEGVTTSPAGGINVAVGGGGVVLRSTDLSTWTRTVTGTSKYFGTTADPDNGQNRIVVGENSEILRSTNAGATWAAPASTPGGTATLWSVKLANTTTGWAVGDNGTIWYTSDAGAHWTTQTSGTTARLYGVWAQDDGITAWAVGSDGTVLVTHNGGTSWNNVSIPTWPKNLRSVSVTPNGGVVVVAGDGSTMERSTDGGTTWNASTTSFTATDVSLTGVDMVTNTLGFASSIWYNAYKTTDGGVNWTPLTGTNQAGYGISALDANNIFIANPIGSALRSSNGGVTWSSYPADQLFGITAISPSTAFAAGTTGRIWSTSPSGGANAQVADYGGAPNNWATGGATNLFGVCLQAINGSTTAAPGWTVDGTGTCAATDAHPWKAVPSAVTKLAYVAAAGATGRADVVWGMRAATNQTPGTYTATITFEALAPNV